MIGLINLTTHANTLEITVDLVDMLSNLDEPFILGLLGGDEAHRNSCGLEMKVTWGGQII